MDASHLEAHFPNLPCLGFYAGGEIGPMAKVRTREAPGSNGAACTHGGGMAQPCGIFAFGLEAGTRVRACLAHASHTTV
jgi:hypothetical protein